MAFTGSADERYAPAGAGSVDVVDVLRGVARRWLMIVSLTIVAAVGAFMFVTTAEVRYTSTAKVIVENLATPFTRVQAVQRNDPGLLDRDVQSQVEVLTGRNLAGDVIDRRISDRARQLLVKQSRSTLKTLLIRFGLASSDTKLAEREKALRRFRDNLTVYRIERSSVIVIEYESSDPAIAAEVANAVAGAYVASTQAAQAAPINDARKWLSEQIEDLRDKVVKSEVAVEEYRAQAGLIQGTGSKLSNQALSELNSQIILAAASRSEAEERAKSIREMLAKTGSVDGASDVINSAFIQRLREQQVRLRRTLADLSTTYLDNHPRIVGVKREIGDLDRQVRKEIFKIVEGLEQQARIAASRESSLRESLQAMKDKASSSNVDEVRLRALEREARANRTLLETFLTRYNDASAREKSTAQPGIARVISNAAVPMDPSFPKKLPIIALATIAGLVLGFGIAFLLEVMAAAARVQQYASPVRTDMPREPQGSSASLIPAPANHHPAPSDDGPSMARPFSPAQPTAWVGQPPSGLAGAANTATLCRISANCDLASAIRNVATAAQQPASAFGGQVATLANWLESLRQSKSVNRVAFTCLAGAELDAAAMVLASARNLAARNVRVVVADADRRNGHVGRIAQVAASAGLSQLINGQAAFSDVIVCDPQSQAHVIVAGLPSSAKPEPDRLAMALDALDQAYDLVLINAGVAEFPANQQQIELTSSQAAVILASADLSGPAQALGSALGQDGQRPVQTVSVEPMPEHLKASGF